MSLINLLQKQVEVRAQAVCQNRNRSLPVELGKSGYEPMMNGVQFIKQHYLLDSSHCDYTSCVARILWNGDLAQWELTIPSEEGEQWIPYPYLFKSSDLTALIREVEKDPKSYIWE
ncbi:DUF3024 domain-containing protein [Vibrio genomosp. F10]|uniref:DUF3024 domain-containing protein n=2 Tax=Vibrio genomosp. F10 TaxID=723171 RepID=A0A1B9QZ81_9VIBR|nr:DUF3024 domain-containing protein [Vibrio genomosp. F10]OCH76217.1 hypothetical protein A6E14_01560 [Vibrio genomosp. F10]OEE32724.1 hypothetical protein A1QO_11255 [Vibrio genomosp. F10 str. ZF-129]OEE81650.1 hypothetical protein A1QK_20780 [Vibrio genomosp. F10 str. 9ZD137]OEE96118.1 hypothetical protein A1QM_17420 [Vibrio genomosp. F10 str. 9ZC157]OEF04483.1 hypothetical protein A1QI_10475 [Vibrio genomosp. F10 str. 9ZB36]